MTASDWLPLQDGRQQLLDGVWLAALEGLALQELVKVAINGDPLSSFDQRVEVDVSGERYDVGQGVLVSWALIRESAPSTFRPALALPRSSIVVTLTYRIRCRCCCGQRICGGTDSAPEALQR
jgi:hypothetical protein